MNHAFSDGCSFSACEINASIHSQEAGLTPIHIHVFLFSFQACLHLGAGFTDKVSQTSTRVPPVKIFAFLFLLRAELVIMSAT